MIDPRRLAFDIDGVVADTMQLFIDIAREVYGVNHIRIADMTTYNLDGCLDIDSKIITGVIDRILSGQYHCRLKPIDGAGGVLRRLGAYGPIHMVTARPVLGPIGDWMEEILPSADFDVNLVATGSFEAKPDVLAELGVAYFVEDRLDTCYLLEQQGIRSVLFAQPWNRQRHPFIEVDGWRQLEAMIDFE